MKSTSTISNTSQMIILPIEEKFNMDHLTAVLSKFKVNITRNGLEDIDGKKSEVSWWYGRHADSDVKIYLVGLGASPAYADCVSVMRSFHKNKYEKLADDVTILLDGIQEVKEIQVEGLVNGWEQGGYDISLYKTGTESRKSHAVIFSGECFEKESFKTALSKGYQIGQSQTSVMDLVNAPSNKKTPVELANWAIQSAERNGFECQILEKKDLIELGMDALLAVNRGSEVPAKCIVMDHTPENYTTTVALVGKGVTFDTGGLSIKGSANMHYMKSDMGGAAATFGALEAAAKLNLPIRVIGIVPATDNSVDAKAIKPGDVIGSYAGKTIEVIDTDAEGRLILADGIAYVLDKYQPDHIIDLATLTGSVIRALGTDCAGLFSNNELLSKTITDAGNEVGERVWALPIWDTYGELMKSDIADIRNLATKPYAGSITAAKFLEYFIGNHKSWAHIDIAGTAFGPNDLSKGYSATAYGVRLLIEVLESLQGPK